MMRHTNGTRTAAIALWLAFVVSCGVVVSRASFTGDLSAFLPRSPTPEQKLLVDQLKNGMVARLILIGIEGADGEARAGLSKDLARRLRAEAAFSSVDNGESLGLERDREFLFSNRYLLSPTVTAERFTVDGLHAALGESIDFLASPAGLLVKALLPGDPTGEITQLLGGLDSGSRPPSVRGVWASRDGSRALLLAQTRAAGYDIDAQQRAIADIRRAFDTAVREMAAPVSADIPRLVMTGPGVFSVSSRETIRGEAIRLSTLSTVIIVTLLLLIYRSLPPLVLGLLPVATGALAGVAAVSLGFGVVHGVTLGFGATLIGEAVDYSIYLFIQSERASDAGDRGWVAEFWPTIRLGVMTSVFGFAALLFSDFPGLAQLGLYSIAGLLVAASVTRFVLPALLPAGFSIRDVSPIGLRLSGIARRARFLRWLVASMLVAACGILYAHRDTLWDHELSALNPVPLRDQILDAELRADMGAPDVRYLAVVSGSDREAALVAAENLALRLQGLVEAGVIAGFESPTRFLPSIPTQRTRLASLPTAEELNERLRKAVVGLPVQAERFAPFLADVKAVRGRRPLQRADLEGTSFALAVDGLLVHQEQRWSALLPLRAPVSGPSAYNIDADRVRATLASSGQGNALFVDLKSESDRLYSGYLREAIGLSLAGLAAILGLLFATLRSPARVALVLAPLVAAVLTVVAGLALAGRRLTILHLVGMLLIVAVGSNYALFFDRRGGDGKASVSPRTLASLVFANLATVAGFGLLATSKVPVLEAIGISVGPGAILALVFSAILADLRAPVSAR